MSETPLLDALAAVEKSFKEQDDWIVRARSMLIKCAKRIRDDAEKLAQAQARCAEDQMRIGKLVVALQEIINAPGGGPAKRIATIAIDEALKAPR